MGATSSSPENINVNSAAEKYKKDIETLNKIIKYYKHDDIIELKNILKDNKIIQLDNDAINNILEKYKDVFSILKSPDGKYFQDTDSIVYNFFKNDTSIVKKAKDTIDASAYIDTGFKKGLVSLLDNTNDLNKKYKYFQYKYMEINLFFMAFVANIHSIVNNYTEYVQFVEKSKYDDLTNAISRTFGSIQSVIEDGNSDDINKFREISLKFREYIEKEHNKALQSIDQKSQETFSTMFQLLESQSKDPINKKEGDSGFDLKP